MPGDADEQRSLQSESAEVCLLIWPTFPHVNLRPKSVQLLLHSLHGRSKDFARADGNEEQGKTHH